MTETFPDLDIEVCEQGGYVVLHRNRHLAAFTEMPQLLEWLARNLTARQSVPLVPFGGGVLMTEKEYKAYMKAEKEKESAHGEK